MESRDKSSSKTQTKLSNPTYSLVDVFIHHQFQTSPMNPLLLIGALLLSTAPVQAFETREKFDEACSASEETMTLCQAAIQYSAFTYIPGILCRLEDDGLLTAEQLAEWWKLNGFNYQQLNAFLKDAINLGLVPYPNCSIKRIP